jgi:hypothetical protein
MNATQKQEQQSVFCFLYETRGKTVTADNILLLSLLTDRVHNLLDTQRTAIYPH